MWLDKGLCFIIHEGVIPKRRGFSDLLCWMNIEHETPFVDFVGRHIVAMPHKWIFDMTAKHAVKRKRTKHLKKKQQLDYTVQSNPDIKDI